MHQQVRTRTTKSREDDAERPDEGLLDILSLLKNVNLRSAGGTNLDDGGEFVFSVHHAEGDDTADQQAADILTVKGYAASVYRVEYCLVDDRKGALLDCIRSKAAELDEPIVEVHVLTSERDRRVPVQIVTRSMLSQRNVDTA
jgi:hypothetical protein